MTEVLPHRCEASDLLSAAVEAVSAHPLATAITAYAQEHGYGGTARPESFENLSGRGLKAVLGGETVLAGNRRLLEEHGVDVSLWHLMRSASPPRARPPCISPGAAPCWA